MTLPSIVDKRIFIIDDYLDTPKDLEDILSILTFGDEQTFTGGQLTTDCVWSNELTDGLSLVLCDDVVPVKTSNCGRFIRTNKDNPPKQKIHVDLTPDVTWVGYLFVSKAVSKTAGVTFWKHKEKNISSIPLSIEDAEIHGMNGFDGVLEFVENETSKTHVWEEELTIPYKYNRLVLFRPYMFRSIGDVNAVEEEHITFLVNVKSIVDVT